MQASRWELIIWRSQGEKKNWPPLSSNSQLDGSVLIWHVMGYRMVFSGLLFVWGTGRVKKKGGKKSPCKN
jgi:hypothetical protein